VLSIIDPQYVQCVMVTTREYRTGSASVKRIGAGDTGSASGGSGVAHARLVIVESHSDRQGLRGSGW